MDPNASNEDITPVIKDQELEKLVGPQAAPRSYQMVWKQAAIYGSQHLGAVYGLYLLVTAATWPTIAFTLVTFYLGAIGSCAGTHRLWSHRSYKVKRPLEIFIMLCHCVSGQFTIFQWARDHRLHHKYSDTDADPHNATRGFFFSHIAWTFVHRHPEFDKRKKLVDMRDLLANPVVMFQKRNVTWLNPLLAFAIPTLIPMCFWKESANVAFFVNMFRFILNLNGSFSINSLAHMFGTKVYDKYISPSQNIITTIITLGEGFHNYHHTFPFDYKAGEFGSFFNFSASFIEFFGRLGLAYDLRSVSDDVLKKRMMRTGDGSADKYGVGLGMIKQLID